MRRTHKVKTGASRRCGACGATLRKPKAPKSIYEALGAILREKRLAQGMSQDEVGKLVGLTRASISNIEAGTQRTLFHTVIDLCRVVAPKIGAHILIWSAIQRLDREGLKRKRGRS